MLVTWVFLHCSMYKKFVKLATFKISEMAKMNADEYFLCIG